MRLYPQCLANDNGQKLTFDRLSVMYVLGGSVRYRNTRCMISHTVECGGALAGWRLVLERAPSRVQGESGALFCSDSRFCS